MAAALVPGQAGSALAVPPTGSSPKAHAATRLCPELLIDQAVRVADIRVSGVSCAEARGVILRYYRLSIVESRRIISSFRRNGYAYALGWRFTEIPYRGRCLAPDFCEGYTLHARRPGQNFYFTDLPPREPVGVARLTLHPLAT